MAFNGRNFLAFFLTQVIVGLMFAAIFSDWYSWTTNFTQKSSLDGSGIGSISSTTQLNYSNIFYNGTGYRITARTSAQVKAKQEATSLYYNWGGENAGYAKVCRVSRPPQFFILFLILAQVVQYFRLSFAFSIIALIVASVLGLNLLLIFFSVVRNYYIKSCGMSSLRWIFGALALGILASNIIALLGFLGVTQGFKDDLNTLSCSDGPCRIFSGAATSQFGEGSLSQYTNWGPEAGWYVTIASIIVSVALCISIATLRFPIPFDTDDSSGEAL